MFTLFDFIDWRGDLTFAQDSFHKVDGLILSAFSYLRADKILTDSFSSRIRVSALNSFFQSLDKNLQTDDIRSPKDLTLLDSMATAPRYKDLIVCGYRTIIDAETETQFAAYTITPDFQTAFIVFRGTDHSLIGWKEDLNLSFMETIPGQTHATAYLADVAAFFPGPLYIAGHSKGGNLAAYASSCVEAEIQNRIKAIYNYDGPGFNETFMKREGYTRLIPKIHTFVPKSSVVGMFLEHAEPYQVVESQNTGLAQHDPYSWNVLGKDFLYLEDVDNSSRFTGGIIKEWVQSLTLYERETFANKSYQIILETNATTLNELFQPQNLRIIQKALSNADEDTKEILAKVFRLLAKSGKSNINQQLTEFKDKLF